LAGKQKQAPFPSRDEVLDFIRADGGEPGEREIARAFRLKGGQRAALRDLLRGLADEGLIERRRKHVRAPGALPPVTVVEIAEIDSDGELIAKPVSWHEKTPPPRILMAPDRGGRVPAGIGERMLARLSKIAEDEYEGRVIRRISAAPDRVLGVYEGHEREGRIRPTDRKFRHELAVAKADAAGAQPGNLVLAEVLPGRRLGLRQARVIERLGDTRAPQAISLIAIHSHDIPSVFAPQALAEAETAQPVSPKGREDLRAVPLVTIDGADARDFDDAVWAEPDDDPKNKGGFRLIVAIADVAYYVRSGSALDRAARERGNSVYFPDRVVPMLPEALSNGLCSLKPGEDRGALACHMRIDKDGRLLRHSFKRAVMRSAARLTYEQVQAAFDGRTDDKTAPLADYVLAPMKAAFEALETARIARETLDLDLPERQIFLDDAGHVTNVALRPRYISHRLIEAFMITANVAAAETLEKARAPCIYRIHDAPDPEKIEALREFLDTVGLKLARGQVVKPAHLNRLLHRVKGEPHERLLNELILRAQAKAEYDPRNIGHYGLALPRYAHFTSPIRRYADLVVHRALIGALKLGKDGITKVPRDELLETARHISDTERRAAAAERDAVDRFAAAYLADRVGATFEGAINGVTRFGLFITLAETGADGLVPISSLAGDYYDHDEAGHRLVGRETGHTYRLGDPVEVRLAEADPITGSLLLELLDAGPPAGKRRGGRAGRPHPARSGKPRRSPGRGRKRRN
jgi:ribonuclease R